VSNSSEYEDYRLGTNILEDRGALSPEPKSINAGQFRFRYMKGGKEVVVLTGR
jgi:hypothetical protein